MWGMTGSSFLMRDGCLIVFMVALGVFVFCMSVYSSRLDLPNRLQTC
jgi:hypothetical protein